MPGNYNANLVQGSVESETEQRIAPPVVHLSADELSEKSVEAEGSILVFYGEADSTAIEKFDDADSVAEFQTWASEEIASSLEAEGSAEPVVSAELTYEGETVVDEMVLAEDSSFGLAEAKYNGGEIDEDEFSITQTADMDVEYRVIVAEPTLAEDEQEVDAAIPEETEDAAVSFGYGGELCGALAIAAGAVAGYAAYKGINSGGLLTEASGAVETDEEYAASVDELVESRS